MTSQTNIPLVSVITITYNRADLIHRCIESIQKQTYQNYEHIIVDGNSEDDTENVVKGYNDPHIRYIKLHTKGPQVQMKAGSSVAKGKYVTFLDDDDEYLPHKLEKQVNLFESLPDDYGIVYCWMSYYDSENPEKAIRVHATKLRGFVGDITPAGPRVCGTPTLMIRKTVFDEFGGTFNDSIGVIMSDWELAARITQKYKVDYVPESLIRVYVNHGHSQLNTDFNAEKVTRNIKFHNHFLTEFKEVFDRHPEYRNLHYYNLCYAHASLREKKEAWHYFKLLQSCHPTLKKNCRLLIKILFNK